LCDCCGGLFRLKNFEEINESKIVESKRTLFNSDSELFGTYLKNLQIKGRFALLFEVFNILRISLKVDN
jgi:hypothetical protein